jgi:hypothetical protein
LGLPWRGSKRLFPATQAESTLIGRSSLLVLPSLRSWLGLDNIYLIFSFEFYIEQASTVVRGDLQSQIISKSSQEDSITEKETFLLFYMMKSHLNLLSLACFCSMYLFIVLLRVSLTSPFHAATDLILLILAQTKQIELCLVR